MDRLSFWGMLLNTFNAGWDLYRVSIDPSFGNLWMLLLSVFFAVVCAKCGRDLSVRSKV